MTEKYLGLSQLSDEEKKNLFEILDNYTVIKNYLLTKLGLKVAEKKLSGVVGMLAEKGTEIDLGMLIGYYFSADLVVRQDWFEQFDWSKLGQISRRMSAVRTKILQIQSINWGMRILIVLRFADWSRWLLMIAKSGLSILIFFTLLYGLVATQWGRDLSWEFLNIYGWIVRLILIVFLIIALVVIVGMVSFMYLENRQSGEK